MAEVTAFRNNALPYPVYGVPWTVVAPVLDADGDPVTTGTMSSTVSINGDTAAAGATPVQIPTNTGAYYVILTTAQMTADIVTITIASDASGAKTTIIVLYPRKLVTLATGTSQGGAVGYITLAAAAISFDGQFNGCLCVATIDTLIEARVLQACTASNQQCTVTPNWNVAPDADDTYVIYLPEGRQIAQTNVKAISDDATAADNCELMFDGTGYAGGTAKMGVDVQYLDGTLVHSTTGGRLAASFNVQYDVASPVFTAACVNQGADSNIVLAKVNAMIEQVP